MDPPQLPRLPAGAASPDAREKVEEALRQRIAQLRRDGVTQEEVERALKGDDVPQPPSVLSRIVSGFFRKKAEEFHDGNEEALRRLTALATARGAMREIMPDLPQHEQPEATAQLSGFIGEMLRRGVSPTRITGIPGTEANPAIPGLFQEARDRVASIPGSRVYEPAAPGVDERKAFDVIGLAAAHALDREPQVPHLGQSDEDIRKQTDNARRRALNFEKAWQEVSEKARHDYYHGKQWGFENGREVPLAQKYQELYALADQRAQQIRGREEVMARTPQAQRIPGLSALAGMEARARAKLAASGPALFIKKALRPTTVGNSYANYWAYGGRYSSSWNFDRTALRPKIVRKTVNAENARARYELDGLVNTRHLAENAPKLLTRGGNVSVEFAMDDLLKEVFSGTEHSSAIDHARGELLLARQYAQTHPTGQFGGAHGAAEVNGYLARAENHVQEAMASQNWQDDKRQKALRPVAEAYAADMEALTQAGASKEDREKVASHYRDVILRLNEGDKNVTLPNGVHLKMDAMLLTAGNLREKIDYLRTTQVDGTAWLLNDTNEAYAKRDKREIIFGASDGGAYAMAANVGNGQRFPVSANIPDHYPPEKPLTLPANPSPRGTHGHPTRPSYRPG